MIIDSGILIAGTDVFAINNKKTRGKLNRDGSITVKINGEDIVCPYPSGAARTIEKKSLNGWIYWCILDSGSYNNLTYYRDIYTKQINVSK